MRKLLPLALLAATPALDAAVDDPDQGNLSRYRMEEVIVTSSRVPMPLRQVGTSVSVVTAEDIQHRGFDSLFDILRKIGRAHV